MKSPIALKLIGPGTNLAASVVEDTYTPITSAAHQFPVLEIVGSQAPGRHYIAGVIWQYFIAKMKAHDPTQILVPLAYEQDVAIITEHLAKQCKITFR